MCFAHGPLSLESDIMRPDHRKTAYLAILSFLSILLLVQTLGAAEEIDTHPGVEAFQSKYKGITEAVQVGTLPPETGAEADGLNLAFQKYLIQSNARIEVYRLEAREYTGARQDEALDNLIQATEERERTILGYIQKLDRLAGGQSAVAPVYDTNGPVHDTKGMEEIMPSPEPETAKKVEEAETEEEKKEKKKRFALPEKKWEVKELDIEIELSPHDMINEPLP